MRSAGPHKGTSSCKEPAPIGIAYVIDFLATREGMTGGTERQLVEMISHLDRERFRPFLFCLQEFRRTPCWESVSCDKRVLHVYSLASLKGALAFLSFVSFLRRNAVDIVQTFFFDSTLFGITAARAAGVKKAVSCRRDLGFWYNDAVLRKLSLVNRITHRILVNSQAVKESVSTAERVGEDRIDVILNGIDLHACEACEPASLTGEFSSIGPRDLVVGMVANCNREVKRIDLFIRAASEVVKKTPGVKFLVIGGGRLEREIVALVREMGLEGIVIPAGARDSAIPYIKSFDIGVLTSDSEGFSNVILEYMAAGIPVVATDVGGNREVIGNESLGMLVRPNDHHALGAALSLLIGHPEARKKMGSRSKALIRSQFAWDRKILEISEYYEGLVKSHG